MATAQLPTEYLYKLIPFTLISRLFVLIWTHKEVYYYTVYIYIFFFFSAIAISHDSLFKKDQDILVLPLDLLKFDTHKKLTQDVLKHFGKVWLLTLNLQNIKKKK